MKLWLICYDITDNQRRYYLDKLLNGYGERVQYSAFECHLTTRQFNQLKYDINNIIELPDKVHIFSICRWCKENRFVQGTARLTDNSDFYGVF